jgi:hypothetical protein
MSPHHVSGIRGFAERDRHAIFHLRDKFSDDTPDVEWLGSLAEEGDWIVISADLRISRNPVEKATWKESGLTAFFFAAPWGNDSFWKQSASLVTWWPEIVRQATLTPAGHGFSLPKGAKIPRQIFP